MRFSFYAMRCCAPAEQQQLGSLALSLLGLAKLFTVLRCCRHEAPPAVVVLPVAACFPFCYFYCFLLFSLLLGIRDYILHTHTLLGGCPSLFMSPNLPSLQPPPSSTYTHYETCHTHTQRHTFSFTCLSPPSSFGDISPLSSSSHCHTASPFSFHYLFSSPFIIFLLLAAIIRIILHTLLGFILPPPPLTMEEGRLWFHPTSPLPSPIPPPPPSSPHILPATPSSPSPISSPPTHHQTSELFMSGEGFCEVSG